MGINTQQRRHYRMLAEEEAARLTIIRALIRLAASTEDREAATRALDRLEVTTSEISFAADESWSSPWNGLLASERARAPRHDTDGSGTPILFARPVPDPGPVACPIPSQSPPVRF